MQVLQPEERLQSSIANHVIYCPTLHCLIKKPGSMAHCPLWAHISEFFNMVLSRILHGAEIVMWASTIILPNQSSITRNGKASLIIMFPAHRTLCPASIASILFKQGCLCLRQSYPLFPTCHPQQV